MRLLIDTQSLIWYVDQNHRLSVAAHSAITDPANDLLVSSGTLEEIAIKVGSEKLKLTMPYRQWMSHLGLAVLPITVEHADIQAGLPLYHRDPFDRARNVHSIPARSDDSQPSP